MTLEQHMLTLIARHGLPLVALMVFGGELGLPTGVPMEVALLLVGGYAVHSPAALAGGLALVAAADLLGTTLLYAAMRTSGRHLLDRLLRHHAARAQAALTRWRARLGGHDVGAVGVGRSLPLVRMYVPIGAGLLGVRLRHFLLGAAPAALVWAGTPLVLGYLLRADVRSLADRYTRAANTVVILLPAIGLLFSAALWVRTGRSRQVRWRRGRAAAGLAAGLGAAVFLGQTAWTAELAARQGRTLLPLPILGLWLGVLAGAAVALVAMAVADARAGRAAPQEEPHAWARLVAAEVGVTLAWAGVLLVVGAVVVGLELRYPVL